MTAAVTEPLSAAPPGRTPRNFAALGSWLIALSTMALLVPWSGRYGYNVDELYFRMLGRIDLAWGYVDQPPLVPAVSRLSTAVFGDTPTGMRLPAALCAGLIVLLGALLTAELGGRRRAQLLCAAGLGSSALVLAVGHVLVTTTFDMTAWAALTLFTARALLRGDGRWWLAAGAACGVAMYSKYMILLFPVSLLAGLAVAGPRRLLRERWPLLGAGLALVVGAPNLVYQLTHDLPQLQMARALGDTDGLFNRVIFVPSLVMVLGLALTPIWVAGLLRLLRDPAWRPVRALAVAALVGAVLLLAGGGRPDYAGGFLIGLFAAGCVVTDRWLDQGRRRRWVTGTGLVLSAAIQVVVALPVLPQSTLAEKPLNDIALESVGWPQLVAAVAAAYDTVPPSDRDRTVLLTDNFGEAGAIDRYGPPYHLPSVYSGHNELYRLGPPPARADIAVVVGVERAQLDRTFLTCRPAGRVDNGLAVQNAEQGKPIWVCQGLRDNWARLWPSYHHLSG